MLTLLLPFIALLTRVQAQDFEKPAQVAFTTKNTEVKYSWFENGLYLTPNNDDKTDIAHIGITRINETRVIKWNTENQDGTGKEPHECSVWLEAEPKAGLLTYELDTDKRTSEGGDTAEAEADLKAFRVECRMKEDFQNFEVIQPPAFKQELTVKFYASPQNVQKPVWFFDSTLPKEYVNDSDKPTNDIKPDDLADADGSVGIGQMTLTHSTRRHFAYQRKLKDSDDVNIDDCEFDVRTDLGVSELRYWPDSKKAVTVKSVDDDVVLEEDVGDKVWISCVDKDGNIVA